MMQTAEGIDPSTGNVVRFPERESSMPAITGTERLELSFAMLHYITALTASATTFRQVVIEFEKRTGININTANLLGTIKELAQEVTVLCDDSANITRRGSRRTFSYSHPSSHLGRRKTLVDPANTTDREGKKQHSSPTALDEER